MKTQIQFLKKNQKQILFVFIFYVALCFVFFPYDDAVQKWALQLSQPYPNLNLTYESSSVGLFPPRLIFQKAELTTPWLIQNVQMDQLTLKPYHLALLAFTLGAKIEIIQKTSNVQIRLKKSFSKKKKEFIIQIQSKSFEVSQLEFLSSFFSHSKGQIEFFLNLSFDPSFLNLPKGVLQLKGRNMEFQPYSFSKKYIGTFNLPLLQWKSLAGKIKTSKGEVHLENLTIGKKTDPFYLFSKGLLNLSLGRFKKSIQDYNIDFNLILDKKIKDQFFFIDLFLSEVEHKISENRFEYSANIKGRSLYPPKIQN